MSEIQFVRLKKEDVRDYINIINVVWRNAYKHIFPEEVFLDKEKRTDERIEKCLQIDFNSEEHIILGAKDDGKLVGVLFGKSLSGYDHFKELGFADLQVFYILPEYQGKGIGTKLKSIFVDWLKDKGIKKFVIGVLKDNKKSRAVYEKWGGKLDKYTHGFEQLGVSYDEVFYTYKV